jgi:hypothetical protein
LGQTVAQKADFRNALEKCQFFSAEI